MNDTKDTQPRISQVDLYIDDAELDAIKPSIAKRWLTEGPNAAELTEEIKKLSETRYAVFAPNGTLGLYLGLLALDLPKGSEIIIPSFTFYGSAMSAVFADLKPVFVDCYEDTYNIDLEDLERKITPQTSAIMPVHIYGQVCDIQGVMEIAKRHGLKVLEDAAQSFGVHFDGQHSGTFGDIAMFSFFSDKVVTMGEGAVLFTQDEQLYERLRLLRNQGRPNSGTFVHPELGMNFRITDLHAAIGLSQLKKLPEIRKRRTQLWDMYRDALWDTGDLRFMSVHPKSEVIPFRVPVTTAQRDDLAAWMQAHAIDTRSFFYPMHLQPKLRSEPPQSLPVSEKLSEQGFCLPVHQHIKDADVERICQVIRQFFSR
ncbi:MAG: DegT/DnrJ/EryC1/StrS family aminotransferase [Hyphomicrobiaceae bacterium]|nr:DegT/DnrJ/EryC1/StrS family aminotransferase [Hyphomicrobiaceae bacterium]